MNGTPAIRQCMVGAALRRYRENMGFGLDEAANVLECDRSKISRIETGHCGIRSRDLQDLLSEYGVGTHEQAVLAALANPKRVPGWWQDYKDVLTGDQQDMMIMESLATQVFIYHTHHIPGLLQTEEYARAAASASNVPAVPAAGQRAVQAMVARQRAILGAEEPELAVVIAEGALWQQVGGADVMRAQLTRLAMASSTYPRVSVRILPFASGAHAGLDAGGLTILRFAETPDLGIVHVPGISGGICLKDHDLVTHYANVFAQIRDAALSVRASAELLHRMAT